MFWYLDASALVKRYVREPDSYQVRELMRRTSIASSRLTLVEIGSAVSHRCREGAFSAAQRDRILKAVEHDFQDI